jgi:two-component sensor histidine kinase
MAISAVHHRLWRADHIQNVDFGSYLEELRDGLVEGWGSAWAGRIKVNSDHVMLPTNQAVVLALVVTELLTNAVKYAYEGRPGSIDVRLRRSRNAIRVVVRDEGVGFTDSTSKTGLGSRLIRSLIAQLDGDLEMSSEASGTSVTLIVPTRPSQIS